MRAMLQGALIPLLVGCVGYTDRSNEGRACIVPVGAGASTVLYADTGGAAPALDAGPSEVLVVLSECYSSSMRNPEAACTATSQGTTVTVTSEGGFGIPPGGINDDCNVLEATCPGPDLTAGTWTLEYGG